MQKAIIFGAGGQDGIYMAELCVKNNIQPIKISRHATADYNASVADKDFVNALVKKEQPDYIFHLAANSTTRYDALFENHETISSGTLYILDAVKHHSPHTKVLITGSGVQFKNTGNPISENTEFEAGNAYAIARIQSVYAARFFRSLGIKTYVAYLFHHESPYRKEHHVSKMITDKIKNIVRGNADKISIGDVSVEKEWAFAEDIVEGIFTLVNQDEVFEATVGTGIVHSINDFLEECFSQVNLDMNQYVETKQNFTSEYPKLVSDPTTINKLGWKAKTDLQKLVHILLQTSDVSL
jgi:GDPmannose 4,6-dehydratase